MTEVEIKIISTRSARISQEGRMERGGVKTPSSRGNLPVSYKLTRVMSRYLYQFRGQSRSVHYSQIFQGPETFYYEEVKIFTMLIFVIYDISNCSA